MTDLLRADKAFTYGRKRLRPGDTFHSDSAQDTHALALLGQATLLEKNSGPAPVKRGRGRPKGYKRRDLTAES